MPNFRGVFFWKNVGFGFSILLLSIQKSFFSGCGVLDVVDVHIAVHDGIDGEGGDTLETEFGHDVLAVGDDGGKSDVQTVGNLLVDEPLYDERHHLYLTVGENLLLEHLRHGRKVASTMVGALLKH